MNRDEWIAQCNHWKNKWPVYLPEHRDDTGGINIYEVLETINNNLTESDFIVADAGSPSYACPTNLKAKVPGQFIFNPSQADMGWAVPASIGVSLANRDKNVIVIVGDGSFFSNVQELAVINYHNLPIKLFVLNNDGYLSIKNTQTKYFEGRVKGVNGATGLYLPNLEKIAAAFELNYRIVWSNDDLHKNCAELMHNDEPMLVEILCKPDQEILPAQAFKILDDGTKIQAPLHDMTPFMTDEELKQEWQK